MRFITIIAGIVLIALGLGAALGKFDYKSKDQIVKLGDVSASAERSHVVPVWAGYAGIVIGIGLIGFGATRRR
jgi:hypothetical protein